MVHQEKQEENELRALPPASAAQLRAVDAAVLETARQHGISEEDFEVRKAMVIRMEEIIKRHLSGCMLWCHSAWYIFSSESSVKRGNALSWISSPTEVTLFLLRAAQICKPSECEINYIFLYIFSNIFSLFFQLVLSVSMVHVLPDLPSRRVISTLMSPTLPQ